MTKSKMMAACLRKEGILAIAIAIVMSVFSSCEGLSNVENIEIYKYRAIDLDNSQNMNYLLYQAELIENGIPLEKFADFYVKTKGNSDQNAMENGDNSVISELNEYASKIDVSKLNWAPYKIQLIRYEKVKKDEITYEAVPKVIYSYEFKK